MDSIAAAPAVRRPNLALWAMIAIPAATVVASLVTLRLAMVGRDPELPAQYAWEGAPLDRDIARAGRAEALGIGAALSFGPSGRIEARVGARPGTPLPTQLVLSITHASRPALDRRVVLLAADDKGGFAAVSPPLPAGIWRLQLEDTDGAWRLRGDLRTGDDGRTPVTLRLGW